MHRPSAGGTGTVGRADGGDDPVLARHVVGGGQHRTGRGPAQDESASVRVGDGEREVGTSTGDHRELEGRDRTVDVVDEPGGDAVVVDAVDRLLHGADRSRGRSGRRG